MVRSHGLRQIPLKLLIALAVSAALFSPIFTTPAYGQTDTIRFESISTEQGLSQSTVTAILQDQQGFLWFGTEGGLNQYDGYQFTVYKHDPDNSKSLSDNVISSIYQDRDGELWIGTSAGLDRFDRKTGTFLHYPQESAGSPGLRGQRISVIFQDRSGMLWAGTEADGLDALDLSSGQFTVYKNSTDDPESLSDNSIDSIYQDRSGALWVGTDAGLDRFDPKTGNFAHYSGQNTPGPRIFGEVPVLSIYEDVMGMLWIGTQKGLIQWNRAENKFTEYRHDPNAPDSLSDDSVTCIIADPQGAVWLGTRTGLDMFDKTRNRFIRYVHDPDDPHSLTSNSIRSIYEDRSGVLWIGTSSGLNKYARTTQKFALYQYNPVHPNGLSDNNIWSIYEDQNGMLWAGTFSAGLDRLDRSSGTFTAYQNNPGDPTSLSSNEIRTILEDHTGALWIGMERGGLDRLDPATGTFIHYRNNSADPGSLSDDDVFSIYEDRPGRIWIGTQRGGLDRLDQASGTFVRYEHDASDPLSLSDNDVRAILEDHTGALWIGTFGGLDLWNDKTDHFATYRHNPEDPSSLSSDMVASVFEDREGTIWAGTFGGGLNRFDRSTGSFTHYTAKDGLPDDTVYGILADSEGMLWLSTNKGVSKFDPQTKTFRNYDVSDGLEGDQFNPGAFFQSKDGEMFFGGTQGLNAFFPGQVSDNPIAPPLVITAFQKFNQTVQTDLASNETIQLSYKDSFISFEFAALDYNAPQKNLYAYQLVGVDKDWVNAGTRRYASYNNLRGGDYIFRVKASNNDGIWNSAGTAIRIHITPPFWQTWWFIGLVGVTLVMSGVGAYRLRVRNMEARNRELGIRVEQRTRQLAALNSIAAVVSRSLNLPEILNDALDKMLELMHMDIGLAFRVEAPENGLSDEPMLNLLAHRGVSAEYVQGVRTLPLHSTMIATGSNDGRTTVRQNADHPYPQVWEANEREGIKLGISIPLQVKDKLVGVISLSARETRPITPEELSLLSAIGQQVGLAVENARLYESAEQSAAVTERNRLARELHDSVTQTLFSASLIAEVLPDLWKTNEPEGWHRLEELRQLTRGAMAEMRTLLVELRPNALVEIPLPDLLRQLCESLIGRARLSIQLSIEGQGKLPPDVQVGLYRITQEALNNVVKHSKATQALVTLRLLDEGMRLSIADNGCGFEIAKVPPDHLGLKIMRERAEAIGARLSVYSEPGEGTQVSITWEG